MGGQMAEGGGERKANERAAGRERPAGAICLALSPTLVEVRSAGSKHPFALRTMGHDVSANPGHTNSRASCWECWAFILRRDASMHVVNL